MLTPEQKINIYKSLFKGREDVFAVHWEKADKSASGYTPVCLNEWKQGVCYKLERKKCKDCPHQNYTSFDDKYIEQHLRGHKAYGIYPLLEGNISYFIVVDFDGKNWQKDAKKFITQCIRHKLYAYLERSRSGEGGHVWLFFQDKYPAHKSRNIIINILQEAKIIDQFAKEDSFDCLIPNQDVLSGKGFGNLIALPLQGMLRKHDNTIFLDLDDKLKPFLDQWDFLQNIKKNSLDKMSELYDKFNQEVKEIKSNYKNTLSITIKDNLYISKNKLPKILINFLRENLNFYNSEALIKKKIGVSTYGMEKYFKLVETKDDSISVPRGFLTELTKFLNENNIKFEIIDDRAKLQKIDFESTGYKLYDYQQEAVDNVSLSENGILVAPAGCGKTIMGVDLITKLKQPALILTHKKQILSQWLERIESFLNIPKKDIGQFHSTKKKIGDKVTVAMVQTLNKIEDTHEISDKFGLIIVDECHHIPAKMFRKVITNFSPYYLYGLTATPTRKNNDEKLIFIYLGDILFTIDDNYNQNKNKNKNKTEVIIQQTKLDVPFKVKTDNFQILSKILIFDSQRNKQIVKDIKKEVKNNLKCLVLTERKEHIEVLSYYLKRKYEILTLTGDLTEKQKREKIKQIKSGNFQILLATGQLIGEGTDFTNLDCLFLVYPFAYVGKLTQYIGRIQRGESKNNTIYDYRDIKIDYLEKFFKKRKAYYKSNFVLEEGKLKL